MRKVVGVFMPTLFFLWSCQIVDAQEKFMWAKQVGQNATYIDRLQLEGSQLRCYGQFSGNQLFGSVNLNSAAGTNFCAYLSTNSGALDVTIQNPLSGFPLRTGGFLRLVSTAPSFSLIRVNDKGDPIWTKRFTPQGGLIEFTDVAEDPFTGSIFTFGLIRASRLDYERTTQMGTYNGLYVMKFDKFGNLIWITPTVMGTGHSAISLELYSNGDPVAVYEANEDIILHRLSQAPTTLWRTTIAHTAALEGIKAICTENDWLYVGGRFEGNISVGSKHKLTSYGSYDGFLARIDPQGQPQWCSSFGGLLEEVFNDFTVDASGNAHCVGQFQKRATFGNRTLSDGQADAGSKAAFVSTVNSAGQFTDARAVVAPILPGGSSCTFTHILSDAAGSRYIVGRARGMLTLADNVKVGNNTSEEYTFASKISNPTTATHNVSFDKGALRLFPNPSAGEVTVEVPNSLDTDHARLEVFNHAGQLVCQKDYQPAIQLSLPAGFYLVRVQLPDGTYYRGKAIVR